MTDEQQPDTGEHHVDVDADAELLDAAAIAEGERLLEEFRQRPADVLNRHVSKRDESGEPASRSAFSDEQIRTGRHITGSDRYRQDHAAVHDGVIVSFSEVLPGRAAYEGNDRAENLVDELAVTRLEDMHSRRLRAATLPESPWSDDYWAIYLGVLGKRYADPKFPASDDWAKNRAYVEDRPAPAIVASGDEDAIRRLSPSEKYDLLVGDPDGTLTTQMWEQGRGYYERDGEVETWMGICHGWAPAAYMLPRPRRYVDALAADGKTTLRFYPADIKALASLLWANAPTVSRFIGGRTNDKDPPHDDNGRITSAKAFDTNPGTWHLSIVNQIGIARRSFVIDATYDYEVWNQPVYKYAYTYFNPATRRFTSRLDDARVPYGEFKAQDIFQRYRAEGVRSLVGVMMRMTYVVETAPRPRETDGHDDDRRHTVKYMYDLELDRGGHIIGGEWYHNKHPDFLWTPPPGGHARAAPDAYAEGVWSGPRDPVPAAWKKAARYASRANKPAPLGKIVERLIDFANA
ncbi:MAG: hypothetical protein H6713_37660 [Myxococcales bacterium]|nr:hypothetical protein [Myxococcales bacterium]MCB9755693.1 hypothetical protein [Myxococcales bacterium]